MHPLILVVCEGKEKTPENVIAKIRDKPATEAVHTIADGLLGYLYEISNKYYTVPVYLCPVSSAINLLDYPLMSHVEGLLVHFDAKDKQFLTTSLPQYLSAAEECNPECKILLCDKLCEEEQEGITYAGLKTKCHLWDVIELSREATEEDEEESALNPIGYDELRDALQNIIWSNVDYSGGDGLGHNEGMNDLIAQLTGTNFGNDEDEESSGPAAAAPELLEDLVEEELDVYEKILTQLLTVQANTASWSRNERLAYLQDMASALDNIIEDD